MILRRDRTIGIGDRVLCKFPRSYHEDEWKGTIIDTGYRPDQWRVQRDNSDKTEIVHIMFISQLSEAA